MKAQTDAHLCLDTLGAQRTEDKFQELFARSETIALEVNSEISKPRTAKHSQFQSNTGVDSVDSSECYFRINVYYAFVDHRTSQLEKRFPDPSQSIFNGCKLIPNDALDITSHELESILHLIFLTKQHSRQNLKYGK